MAELAGTARIRERKSNRVIEVLSEQISAETYTLPDDYEPSVKNGEIVKAKQPLGGSSGKKAIRTRIAGKVQLRGRVVTVTSLEPMSQEYLITPNQTIRITDGAHVEAGEALTEGHLDLGKLLKYRGLTAVERYVIDETQKIYTSQGQAINDKHIEIVLRQMLSKVLVLDGGDTELLAGQIVDKRVLVSANDKLKRRKDPALALGEPTIYGVTRVALTTESFLSAASFQETTSVLIDAAIRGAIDPLKGLKENVIIGRLIPAGTGLKVSPKQV